MPVLCVIKSSGRQPDNVARRPRRACQFDHSSSEVEQHPVAQHTVAEPCQSAVYQLQVSVHFVAVFSGLFFHVVQLHALHSVK